MAGGVPQPWGHLCPLPCVQGSCGRRGAGARAVQVGSSHSRTPSPAARPGTVPAPRSPSWPSVCAGPGLAASTGPVLQCRAAVAAAASPESAGQGMCVGPSPTAWLLLLASCTLQKGRQGSRCLLGTGQHWQLQPGPVQGGVCCRQGLVPGHAGGQLVPQLTHIYTMLRCSSSEPESLYMGRSLLRPPPLLLSLPSAGYGPVFLGKDTPVKSIC